MNVPPASSRSLSSRFASAFSQAPQAPQASQTSNSSASDRFDGLDRFCSYGDGRLRQYIYSLIEEPNDSNTGWHAGLSSAGDDGDGGKEDAEFSASIDLENLSILDNYVSSTVDQQDRDLKYLA
jgi:hypothetical protein